MCERRRDEPRWQDQQQHAQTVPRHLGTALSASRLHGLQPYAATVPATTTTKWTILRCEVAYARGAGPGINVPFGTFAAPPARY